MQATKTSKIPSLSNESINLHKLLHDAGEHKSLAQPLLATESSFYAALRGSIADDRIYNSTLRASGSITIYWLCWLILYHAREHSHVAYDESWVKQSNVYEYIWLTKWKLSSAGCQDSHDVMSYRMIELTFSLDENRERLHIHASCVVWENLKLKY